MAEKDRRKDSSTAMAICDRSGGKYPMRDMVVEPGTHLLVHKRFSDGQWNPIDHPANNIQKYAKFGDPFPIRNARPDINWGLQSDIILTGNDGSEITDLAGTTIEVK